MSTVQFSDTRAARRALGVLLSNGAGAFCLLLATRYSNISLACEAKRSLAEFIHQRIAEKVALGAGADDAANDCGSDVQVALATEAVMAMLSSCASRSADDFGRWLDRRIADVLDPDPDGGPPALAPLMPASCEWDLHQLPIPRAARAALIDAVTAALTAPERRVLALLQQRETTWMEAAAELGLSLMGAKRLHRNAQERARAIALTLVQRAVGRGDDDQDHLLAA